MLRKIDTWWNLCVLVHFYLYCLHLFRCRVVFGWGGLEYRIQAIAYIYVCTIYDQYPIQQWYNTTITMEAILRHLHPMFIIPTIPRIKKNGISRFLLILSKQLFLSLFFGIIKQVWQSGIYISIWNAFRPRLVDGKIRESNL